MFQESTELNPAGKSNAINTKMLGVGVQLFLKGYALREECYGTDRVVRQA